MTKTDAMRATRNGAVAAFIAAGLTLLLVLYAVLGKADGELRIWNEPWAFLDIILITFCALGLLKHSRAASVILFLHYLFALATIHLSWEMGSLLLLFTAIGLVFLYFYAKAIQGAFVYHKLQREETSNFKTAPKWLFISGILSGVLVFVLLVIGMLITGGILPETRVVKGSELSTRFTSTLIDEGIVRPDEEIKYFFSGGAFSILERGSILTNKRVISYTQEDGELQVNEVAFQDIQDIELIEEGNSFTWSLYQVHSYDEDESILLFLSAEGGGDIEFVDAIKYIVGDFH